MRKYLMILLGLTFFVSCEETSYQLQILIRNETNNTLTIRLYPISELMHYDYYFFCELDNISISGAIMKPEFELEINAEREVYISGDLDIEPNILTSLVFDSIHVISFNENLTELKFSPDTVIGYSENLYVNDSFWKFEIRDMAYPTNFRRNPFESHDYIFVISEDKYLR